MNGTAGADLAVAHLRLRMTTVNADLRVAVAVRAALSAHLDQPDLAPLCVTDRQVAVLLDQVDALTGAGDDVVPVAGPVVIAGEQELRRAAAEAGVTLPIDRLAVRFGLTPSEVEAILLVAAPEIDPAYERIYGYVVDDLSRGLPCVELLAQVGACPAQDRLRRRRWLGPAGTLRRTRLLLPVGQPPVDARQELRLADGLLDVLLGLDLDLGAVAGDPAEVVGVAPEGGTGVDPGQLSRVAAALARGDLGVVAIWGGAAAEDVVLAVAAAAGRAVRRLDDCVLSGPREQVRAAVQAALRMAGATASLLWIEVPDVDGPDAAAAESVLAQELAVSTVPLCLTGPAPWRPPVVLAARPYVELDVVPSSHSERLAMWAAAAPDAPRPGLERLAARYRLGALDVAAVAALARTEAATGNGHRLPVDLGLERAAATVSQRQTTRMAGSARPDRSADELILPPGEFRQVMEVASFFDAWPRAAEQWGFAEGAGGRGLKALFTGEPGTGKTLAAQVIASRLGLTLVTIDLARLVSKWVGETEKNLDTAFREAQACNGVLFFDEADALFGKRGQVEHGTDRWANLEVGYLLQRLEAYDGLVILASNLRENIDPAFIRRFSIVVHFPRPQHRDRRRLWQLAFPPQAPLAGDVDLDALAELDLTGSGITSAARTAALLAAQAGASAISMTHAVHGVSRQYQREARVLRPGDLGIHAALLDDGHG